MRLHRLRIEAFGPFATVAEVDFDRLSAGGLFLLTGATGAGKTSVLDAVCFALYGEVPGDRQAARRLRCDQAPVRVRPEVELELTVAGRRLLLVRSPSWTRPKKRGSGSTVEQASVRLSERHGDDWRLLSHRIDETAQLVSGLLGLTMTQFCQVAMLPQGRFQEFLRAPSEDRQRLLQHLFRTRRFEDVERWLRDHRLRLRRECDVGARRIDALANRVSEVAESPVPARAGDPSADSGHDADRLRAWTSELLVRASRAVEEATSTTSRAAEAERRARTAVDAGHRLTEARARLDAAAAERTELVADSDRYDALRARLRAAQGAAAVAPIRRLAAERAAGRALAEQAAAGARDAALPLVGTASRAEELTRALLEEVVEQALADAATARAAAPQASVLDRLEAELAVDERRLAELAEAVSRAEEAERMLPGRVAVLRRRVEAADRAAATLPGAEQRLRALDERSRALVELPAATAELAAARTARDEARAVTAARREAWLDVREARLAGMAAEIATGLQVGAACPVCGSAEHPGKAAPSAGAPDATAERAALRLLDDAKAAETAHDDRVRDLTTRLAVLDERASSAVADVPGDASLEAVRDLCAEALGEVAQLRDDAAGRDDARQALTAAEQALVDLRRELEVGRRDSLRLTAAVSHRRERAAAVRAEVAALLAGTTADSLPALVDLHHRRAEVARVAVSAADDLARAADAAEEAARALAESLAEHAFGTEAQAAAAELAAPEVERLARELRHRDDRLAVTAEILQAPGTAELMRAELPDLELLAAAHATAARDLRSAAAAEEQMATRRDRLRTLHTDLTRELDCWEPVRSRLDVATGLSALVEGRSADNRLQMRLSAYVLADRLTQVVAAANARLGAMSDQRYHVEHTGRRGVGENRGGLSLAVRDDWSGESRDPATLSGGETFVVSLALALGLADVVAEEAGGADLHTLFVDEGFGSLDADTLDDVMDTLDTLREGGRVVGLVSHVAELRARVPTQLCVDKHRSGSTIRQASRSAS